MPISKEGITSPREGALPVTLLSGFLGAGKTTLLKRLLQNSDGLRIGALVNDVSAVNIDGAMVVSMDRAQQVVQLENGCICCTLQESFVESLLEMSQNKTIDYCVVESTGVSEPRPVAEAFTFAVGEEQDEDGKKIEQSPLSKFVRLDTCVTVVDAKNFPETLEKEESARERWGEEGSEAERNVAEILADQLEFADVVIVNKCDLVNEAQAKKVSNAVRGFNVGARIIQATQSNVAVSDVVGTNLFDLEKAESDSRWLSDINKETAPKSELDEFGISSIVYRRRRPFHAERFAKAADELAAFGSALLRSKGNVWLASKNEGYAEWSQTGVTWSITPGGYWYIDIPKEKWGITDPEFVRKVEADMVDDPKIGDRRQELVFIGQGLKEREIIDLLDQCLLNDEEMEDDSKWSKFPDPFGKWDFSVSEQNEQGDQECGLDDCSDHDCEEEANEEDKAGIESGTQVHDDNSDQTDVGDEERDGAVAIRKAEVMEDAISEASPVKRKPKGPNPGITQEHEAKRQKL